MNFASLELSKTLHELSGWKTGEVERDNPTMSSYNESNVICYRYSLGYLLRKLPKMVQDDAYLYLSPYTSGMWAAYYQVGAAKPMFYSRLDTPEDCAAKLAIELFKQKILVKENINE